VTQVPEVFDGAASVVTSTGATLQGAVNPEGSSTVFWFQYGTDSSTLDCTSASTPEQYVAGTSSQQSFAICIAGLTSGTKYFYAACGWNGAPTIQEAGPLQFTTLAPPTVSGYVVNNSGADIFNVAALSAAG